jgi:hypothetical protein
VVVGPQGNLDRVVAALDRGVAANLVKHVREWQGTNMPDKEVTS